jgi:hypothetical protein
MWHPPGRVGLPDRICGVRGSAPSALDSGETAYCLRPRFALAGQPRRLSLRGFMSTRVHEYVSFG